MELHGGFARPFALLPLPFLILRETGVGADVMKPIAAPLVGGMITSTIHVLILVPVFFALMKERAPRRGTLVPPSGATTE
jgi:Cu/Ag efflux pump CusA